MSGVGPSQRSGPVEPIDAPEVDDGGGATQAARLAREVQRLRLENARLQATYEELGAEAEGRARRVSQLIGERAQLEKQLARAEAALHQLNRELGAAASRQGTSSGTVGHGLWRELAHRLRRLTERHTRPPDREDAGASVSAPQPAGRPAVRDEPPGPEVSDQEPLVAFAADGQRRRTVAVLAFGLAREQRAGVLDVVATYGAQHALVPLVLTDDDDFAPLRARQMVFEYLPPAATRATPAPEPEWETYLLRRLALIRRKWRPIRIVAFGPLAAGIGERWKGSPFESDDIAGLFGAPPVASPR